MPIVRPEVKVESNVPTPMRDGTLLRADVYLPERVVPVGAAGAVDAGQGFPTLVCRTPYD